MHDLLLGLYHKQTVYAEYRSKKDYSSRLLSPHAVIYAHNRYVVRCYCHYKLAYLDFNLSRFKYTKLDLTEEWVSGREDNGWNTYIKLHYVPNPDLPQEIQRAVRADYMLDDGEPLQICCRKAVAWYVKSEMSSGKLESMARWVRV